MVEATVTADATATGTQGQTQVLSDTSATKTTVAAEDRSWIPEDIRGDASLKEFKSPADLAKTWVAREKLFSDRLTGMVKIPGEGAKPEELAAWRKATGVPDAATDYTLDVAEDLQHLVPKDRLGDYAVMFHELGVPKGTAQKIVSRYAESMQKQLLAVEQANTQAREALRKEWGEETFTRRLTLADRAIKALVSEEDQAFLQRAGIAGHPFWLKHFARLGEQMAEDGIIETDVAGAASNQQLASRMKEILNDTRWLSGKHPQQALLTQEYQRLMQQLNPEPIR